jgi:hypothetical protein
MAFIVEEEKRLVKKGSRCLISYNRTNKGKYVATIGFKNEVNWPTLVVI